ncbi:hypothetical protein [Rhabdochlamydiaceae symbiont of Dictyostelium giganteum]|uniref:hypothetical protein n=1 Tax=Rhabdochlamydiaceae symbiont of Dictyostelium giganteum TaxID=3342349 RepID=UPI00384B0136
MNVSNMSSHSHSSPESEGSSDESSPRIHQSGKTQHEETLSQKQTASKTHAVVKESIEPLIRKRSLGKEEITQSIKKMNTLPPLESRDQDTQLVSAHQEMREQDKQLEDPTIKKPIQTTTTTTSSSTIQEPISPRDQASSSIQLVETKMALVKGSQALSQEMIRRLEKLISLPIPEDLSVEKIAIFVFEALQEHIENKVLTEEFIQEAHACLFHSELDPFSQVHLQQEMSFIRPHAALVIHSLADCLKALPQERDFVKIMTQARQYTDEMREIQKQKKIKFFPLIKFFKNQNDEKLMDKVNHCPLYTANDWFSVSNQHPVFILRTQEFAPEWVFKPATLEEDFNETDIRDCEHYAFKMNFHEQFPIPAVFSIRFRGVSGTIQPFISDTINFDQIPEEEVHSLLPALRKLLIFDLLFINHDRNFSNILYKKEGDTYTCYGIDHEKSLKYKKDSYTMDEIEIIKELSREIKLRDFDESIKVLYSEKYCNEYIKILKECFNSKDKLDQSTKYDFDHASDEQMLGWIENVGAKLRNTNDLSVTVSTIQNEMRIFDL